MLNVAEILSSDVSLKLAYGLGFMFFTLLIASLSDLKSLTIKAEFVSMWLGFSILMFIYDLFYVDYVWWKWLFIIILGILSWKGLGKMFSLARADVIAVSAVCAVLEIPHIFLFYIILIITNKIGIYPLRLFGKQGKYPFMPVIWVSLMIMIFILGVVNWNILLDEISSVF